MSAEQQLSAVRKAGTELENHDLDSIRDAAVSIYNQYLSEKVPQFCLFVSVLTLLDNHPVKTIKDCFKEEFLSNGLCDRVRLFDFFAPLPVLYCCINPGLTTSESG